MKELHIFSSQLIPTPGTGITKISLLSVSRVEEINYDEHRTKKQHTRVWLISGGVVVGLLLLMSAAAAASLAGGF